MRPIALTAFYAEAPGLNEPVAVTKSGAVIGIFYPIGTEPKVYERVPTAFTPGFNPVPKPTKREKKKFR